MRHKLIPLWISLALAAASGQVPAVVGGGYNVPSELTVAPGQIITLFVTGIGKHLTSTPLQPADPAAPLPLVLGGISVTLHQTDAPTVVSAPILAAVLTDTCQSPRNSACNGAKLAAVSVQVPYELAAPAYVPDPSQRGEAILTVQEDSVASADFLVAAVPSNIHFVTGAGPLALDYIRQPYIHGAAVMHADGSPVSPGLPARAGETVVLYGYGFGRPFEAVKTGQIAQTANPVSLYGDVKFSVLLAQGAGTDPGSKLDASEYIKYAGVAPGTVGLYQLNLQVPPVPSATPACGEMTDWNVIVTVPSSVSAESLRFCVQP